MIYPSEFPNYVNNEAEKEVFNRLEPLSQQYDILYSRKFLATHVGETNEYEIDFIISIPNKAILCLEVKGGIITYNGESGEWKQNSKLLHPGPDKQATSAAHNLVARYDIASYVPIGWAVCFPDCEIPYNTHLPTSLPESRVIDKNSLLYIDAALENLFNGLFSEYPYKHGCAPGKYQGFKRDLLRGIGFVQTLGTQVRYDEERFLQLAEHQVTIFKRFQENDRLVVSGPAGSGKTIIAKTLAQELAARNKQVLLMCFNRTLMNKLAYEDGIRHNDNIKVNTFHSFAKRSIEALDPEWLTTINTKDVDVWNIDIPVKLDNLIYEHNFEKYDCIIIDEGQDFKDFWFECLFKLLKPDGKAIVFLDRMQDIFNRQSELPSYPPFFKVSLPENCRNTKKIVRYLEQIVNSPIETWNNPEGEEVVVYMSKNKTELQTKLTNEIKELTSTHKVQSNQILIILNSDKSDSSIADLKKIGSLDLRALDRSARFERKTIHYTTIDTFKGLEADVVFVLDTQKIDLKEKVRKLYTEASRAKHKLYIYAII